MGLSPRPETIPLKPAKTLLSAHGGNARLRPTAQAYKALTIQYAYFMRKTAAIILTTSCLPSTIKVTLASLNASTL